jgi:hypothetical protein
MLFFQEIIFLPSKSSSLPFQVTAFPSRLRLTIMKLLEIGSGRMMISSGKVGLANIWVALERPAYFYEFQMELNRQETVV